MKRKLIFGERIMYVDAQTPLNAVFTVTLRGAVSPFHLRAALFKLQQKHPLLRARIEEDGKGVPFFVISDVVPEIPVEVQARLSGEDWERVSHTEWSKPFDKTLGPLARVVWLKSDEVSDLLVVCAHCICDGTSFVTLMRELLVLMDRPEEVMPRYASFGSVRELLPGNGLTAGKVRWKGIFFAVLARVALGLRTARPSAGPAQPYLLHWKMDPDFSTAFTTCCKARNTTVHAALAVAFLEAFDQLSGLNAKGKLICPADIRRFLPAIRKDMLFAFAPILELYLDKTPGQDFWTKAQRLKEALVTKMNALDVEDMLMTSEYLHGSVKAMVRFLRTTPGTHDLTFSNMGRLDIPSDYRSFTVEAIHSPSVAFPWRNANTLVVSFFREQMDFMWMSDARFLSYADACRLRDKAMERLALHTEANRDSFRA
jgi:DNA-binding transcriptional regulator/RsmH inhibitor MraZ